jgi:ferritin-like metal-binding protein YciE
MTRKVTDRNDLLIHELQLAVGMEREIALMLATASREAHDPELAEAPARHLVETRHHARALESALDRLGEGAGRLRSPAVDGLRLQHDAFAAAAGDDIPPDVLDLELLTSTAAIEHHEISVYESLTVLADATDQPQLAELLRENLSDDKRLLTETRRMTQKIGTNGVRNPG